MDRRVPKQASSGIPRRYTIRRAWPADKWLSRYFILCAVGPSIHSTLEVRTISEGCRTDEPAWLLQQCQIGLLIHQLPLAWRDVVMARWAAWLAQEDARRVFQWAQSKARKLEGTINDLRARDGARVYRQELGELSRQFGEAKKLAGLASQESNDARTRRRRFERHRAYQLGMERLSKELEDVETLELLIAKLRAS